MKDLNVPPVKPPKINDNKVKRILIGVFIFMSFTTGWYFGHFDYQTSNKGFLPQITNKEGASKNVDFSLFWKVWDQILQKYDGKADTQKMLFGAIKGMVSSLDDPYTVFMDPEESKDFLQELGGSVSGIGAEVGIKNNLLTVIAPISNSPAEKAGLRAGDIILKIDDQDTLNMSLDEAVMKIRGAAGTKVKLLTRRDKEEKTYEITREQVDIDSVKTNLRNDGIAVIEISRFEEDTADKLKESANELISKNVKGVILDLRNNPGGFLDSSISVSSEFIKDGVVVTEKKNDGSEEKSFKASGQGKIVDKKIPVTILINRGSASASEIVAGAIRDSGRGILIGEKTFGKGSVQEVLNIGQDSSLRVTVAHWFTPSGKSINKEGLKPDIEVKMTDEDFNLNKDPQLDKAIEYIKSKI